MFKKILKIFFDRHSWKKINKYNHQCKKCGVYKTYYTNIKTTIYWNDNYEESTDQEMSCNEHLIRQILK